MDASYQITRFDDHRGGVQLRMHAERGVKISHCCTSVQRQYRTLLLSHTDSISSVVHYHSLSYYRSPSHYLCLATTVLTTAHRLTGFVTGNVAKGTVRGDCEGLLVTLWVVIVVSALSLILRVRGVWLAVSLWRDVRVPYTHAPP